MNIGRLSLNLNRDAEGRAVWGRLEWQRPICGCFIVTVGVLVMTWHGRECKCQACGRYICRCIN